MSDTRLKERPTQTENKKPSPPIKQALERGYRVVSVAD